MLDFRMKNALAAGQAQPKRPSTCDLTFDRIRNCSHRGESGVAMCF
jgi:hypothetical protein